MKSLKNILFLFLLIITFTLNTSCNNKVNNLILEESTLKSVDWVEHQINFIFSKKDGNDFSIDAIEKEQVIYIETKDFIDLCNKINSKYNLIEDIALDSFNSEDMTLKVKYLYKTNIMNSILGGDLGKASLRLDNFEYDGNDSEKTIHLRDQLIEPIWINNKIYIPIDLINYVIYSGQPYFLKMSNYKYDLSYYFDNEFTKVISNYNYDLSNNYKLSLELLDNYLKINYKNYHGFVIPEVIGSYPEYYVLLYQMLDSLEDYHFKIISNISKDLQTQIRSLGFEQIVIDSFSYQNYMKSSEKKQYKYSEPQWLSNDILYIPIRSFDKDDELLKVDELLNKSDMNRELEIIFDFRDNIGGRSLNVFKMLKRFMDKSFTIKVGTINKNEKIGEIKYTIKEFEDRNRPYSFTLIVNENVMSAGVVATSLIKLNYPTVVIGREPKFKQTGNSEFFQLIDGTLITLSRPNYAFIHNEEILNNSKLVDKVMTDEEIETFINNQIDK